MIGNDAIVFDGVAHVFNFEKKNALGPAGEMFINHLYAFHNVLTPEGQPLLPAEEFLRQWTVDVKVVWDPVWTMDRLSRSAREKLAMPLEDLEPYRAGRSAA